MPSAVRDMPVWITIEEVPPPLVWRDRELRPSKTIMDAANLPSHTLADIQKATAHLICEGCGLRAYVPSWFSHHLMRWRPIRRGRPEGSSWGLALQKDVDAVRGPRISVTPGRPGTHRHALPYFLSLYCFPPSRIKRKFFACQCVPPLPSATPFATGVRA